MKPAALFLFDKSTVMARPWANAGYDCYCVDIQHPKGETRDGNIIRVGADMRRYVPPFVRQWVFACAFTPCTDTAVSGARWFKGKGLYALADSIELFARSADTLDLTGAPGFIENPIGTLSSYWRKPDHIFHPWQFAHIDPAANYTKATCLWGFNGFQMPAGLLQPDPTLPEPDDRIHKAAPGDDRADFRSATPPGFPQAVYDANCPEARAERLAA